MAFCPKCEKPNTADECVHCGIIVVKYNEYSPVKQDRCRKLRTSLVDHFPLIKKIAGIASVAVIMIVALQDFKVRPLRRPAGILVNEEPQQVLLTEGAQVILHNGEVLQPLADYTITARLILKESYRFDGGAKLSPIDLCVGWGPLSDTAVIDQLSFSQSFRFCNYRWRNEPPLPEQTIASSAANIHAIPATESVKDQLGALRPGQVITLKGQLVRADRKDGSEWVSSLSRDDTGPGACELMYVRTVLVEAR